MARRRWRRRTSGAGRSTGGGPGTERRAPPPPACAEIESECPAKIPDALRTRLERLTLACAKAFGLCGYARVDFRMNRRGKLFALEGNPNPDTSSNAGLARAARVAGL